MINNVPRNVFSFLHTMWGGVRNKYVTFLSPKKLNESKKDLLKLTADCQAIVWILKNRNADYTNTVAKCYSNEDVFNFAASTAVIFEHEKIFDLCCVDFDEQLLSDNIVKSEVLRFYVDYPPAMNLIRFLYSHYKRNHERDVLLEGVNSLIFETVTKQSSEILAAIQSLSHFQARDYAIALQDYEHPDRAEAFFRALEKTLSDIVAAKKQ